MQQASRDENGRERPSDEPAGREEYGFYGRLSAGFPSQVIIDVTEVCNLACVHCPHPQFKASEYYAGRFLPPELNAKAVDEVRDHSGGATQYIRYSSEGEPLIHPKGHEMIEYAARNSGVYVTLTTNGTIMDEQRTRKLLDSGVHMIDISIDASTPETYSRIRVRGDLDVTERNVVNLIEWIRRAKLATKVVVSFIEQPENAHEAPEFERLWTDRGADHVVIRRLHSAAGAVVPTAQLMRKKQQHTHRRPCVYPWERVVLNPRGYLSFCPADWTHGSTMVDYRTTTLRETWTGEFYESLRRAHVENDFAAHGFCGQCPDWEQTVWPARGTGYADVVQELKGA